ncbi:hypothetical protein F8M41_006806 [Gigaspora margarita]|uniref:Uncharacterized protein n=1 Tax=Gigaspora margarita TaxID=4874 RepID=A0A8H3X770_GIGMA|nr:hypothetical protein F8M41_006806 [Gigaspora margarita]
MVDLQTTITSLRKLNTKFTVEISELRKKYAELETKNIEVNVENAKLKQTLKDYEARFTNLVHKDEEKAIHLAKLDDEIKEIKQSSTNTSSIENSDNTPEQCQPIRTETKLLEDKETDDFLDGTYRKSVSDGIRQRNKEKKLQDSETFVASRNTTTPLGGKNGQGLIQEMSSSMSSLKEKILEYDRNISNKALIAEECTLEANQEEIFCWYHYGRNFILQEKALCYKNKIGEKKAKGLIYEEVMKQLNILRKKRSQDIGLPLPDVSRDSLRKKTQRALKIYV